MEFIYKHADWSNINVLERNGCQCDHSTVDIKL